MYSKRSMIGCGTGLVVLCALSAASAGPFNGLVVFGDSLSDVGNVETLTEALSPLVTPTPGPYYYQGRFSNGPNYVDVLSAGLGLGASTASVNGGTNYAYGGALATGTPYPNSVVIQDLDDQVSQYLTASPVADPHTLYLVYIGANDVADTIDNGGTAGDVTTAAQRVVDQIQLLYNAGARQFLVPNLPALGLVPEYSGPSTSAEANALAADFNAALASDLDTLDASAPGIKDYRLDVAGLFANLVANPSAYGLTNVTDPAAPGLTIGDTTYDTSLEVPNPNQYLFWDSFHPTAKGNVLLGQAALALVPEPATLTLLAFCAGGVLLKRRRR
jgi:outer membrane lipase/esterase